MCDCCTKFYRHALIKSGIKIMIDFKCSDFLNYKCFCKYCVLSYVIQLYSIECGLVNNMVLFNRMLINSLKLFISFVVIAVNILDHLRLLLCKTVTWSVKVRYITDANCCSCKICYDSPYQLIYLIWVFGAQLCKIDSEGKARKVVGCSCVVVKVKISFRVLNFISFHFTDCLSKGFMFFC